ncbi:MAG: hypothetical protein ACRDRJ_49640, partial [Streptosporangiaceae bacterium]
MEARRGTAPARTSGPSRPRSWPERRCSPFPDLLPAGPLSGFGRLLRHPEPEASISPATTGRDTRRPRARVIDSASFPATASTRLAGLLLAIPDLAALDLPALARAAGYPGTKVIPAASWLLSLLALKLTATRRVSHVDDLLDDPASALFAGLAVLPKKSALTEYSYRLSHEHQRSLLAAPDQKMIGAGLAAADEAVFDLDFHAVMHWGHDPGLERHYVPTRSQRARSADLLRPGLPNPQPRLRQRRHLQGKPEVPRTFRTVTPLRWGRPERRNSWLARRSPILPSSG